MGNCLEPSESEIRRARRAKAEKLMTPRGVHPKMMYYPQPLGSYMGPTRVPSSIVAVERQTGQQYLVHYPDSPGVFYGDPRLPGLAVNGGFVGGPGRRESWPIPYAVEHPNEQRRKSSAKEEGYVNGFYGFKGHKKQRHPLGGLFTTTGVVDFQEEGEIILDYIDPDPVTVTSTVKNNSDNNNNNEKSTSPTNHVTENNKSSPSSPPANGDIISPPNGIPPNHVNGNLPANEKNIKSKVGFSDEIDTITETPKHINIDYAETPVHEKTPDVPEPSRSLPDILFKPSTNLAPSLPFTPVDVVITYSFLGEYELDIVRRLTRQIQLAGLTVWAERLGDSCKARKSNKTSEAISVAKVLIVLLSEGSCEQRFIRDHVAIATMANISIFPVASEPPQDVLNAMPLELKVQLSPYKWEELTGGNEDSLLFQLRSLARSVHDAVDEHKDVKSKGGMAPRGNLLIRKHSATNAAPTANAASFWDVHFGHRDNVKWERLVQAMMNEYKALIDDAIPRDTQTLLFKSLHNRLVEPQIVHKASDVVYRGDFVGLCESVEGPATDVWEAIVRIAGQLQAVRDVLEEESTVRTLVAEYIEHFSSPELTKALLDLLADPDPNLRATTAMSLARCVTSPNPVTVEAVKIILKDDDYLVREAGCLALGYLNDESAVEDLLHVWGHDMIIQVRDAAKVSLERIKGQEIMDAMKDEDVSASTSPSTNENAQFTYRSDE